MTARPERTASAVGLDAFFGQDLSQFEPDPDGEGSTERAEDVGADGGADDPQWIVWADPARESEWAATELGWVDPPRRR